ncbi:hypothetical protein QWZ16_04860 [Vibrio ostreicida]|uniref:Uncharacterized protein n=1 Tax=Vibrio ostreicida TaxID=526588 RepID=A0ABT8BQW2_9VIBR|nr:hypothetical protein [Vibrio ostreicida]MDN3609054.1 hypothetical protein [Vibrio ostreicida]
MYERWTFPCVLSNTFTTFEKKEATPLFYHIGVEICLTSNNAEIPVMSSAQFPYSLSQAIITIIVTSHDLSYSRLHRLSGVRGNNERNPVYLAWIQSD